jgi:hypothetical protein
MWPAVSQAVSQAQAPSQGRTAAAGVWAAKSGGAGTPIDHRVGDGDMFNKYIAFESGIRAEHLARPARLGGGCTPMCGLEAPQVDRFPIRNVDPRVIGASLAFKACPLHLPHLSLPPHATRPRKNYYRRACCSPCSRRIPRGTWKPPIHPEPFHMSPACSAAHHLLRVATHPPRPGALALLHRLRGRLTFIF